MYNAYVYVGNDHTKDVATQKAASISNWENTIINRQLFQTIATVEICKDHLFSIGKLS